MCAYAHDYNPSLDKLSTKALKCVFVGYSNTQKGYRCYHPVTRITIVTKNVTFNEHQFYCISDPKEEENRKEISKESVRMKILLPPNHDAEGDAIPISRGGSHISIQREESVKLDDIETLPLNMFPKYYVMWDKIGESKFLKEKCKGWYIDRRML